MVNTELFKRLLYAKKGLLIEWIHVKGHGDSVGNNRADSLARGLLDAPRDVICALTAHVTNLQRDEPEILEVKKRVAAKIEPNFVVKDDVVYYIDKKVQDGDPRRVYVPKNSRQYLLRLAHDNGSFGGHLGIKKTHRKLCRFWWPQMVHQVMRHLSAVQKSDGSPYGLSSQHTSFEDIRTLPCGYCWSIK